MNLKSMAAVAVASGVVTSVAAGDAVQWRVEDGGNGHWYEFLPAEGATWDNCRSIALLQGAELASVLSAAEKTFVTAVMSFSPLQKAVWLGGTAPQGMGGLSGWTWSDGGPWDYAAWGEGLPNNSGEARRFVVTTRDGVLWDDFRDQDAAAFVQGAVIEWSSDCNSDGIVDYGQCRDGSLPDYNGNNVPDCCEQGTACAVGSYPVEWRVTEGGNGHWYQLRTAPLIWTAARAQAQSMGADLVTLESAAEQQWLTVHVPAGFFLAGGIQDANAKSVSSGWRWLSGGVIEGFAVSFDDNPCGASPSGVEDGQQNYMEFVGAIVGDINSGPQPNCSDLGARQCIIEWSSDCNSDGIVDYGQILSGELADTNDNGVPDLCEQTPCPGDIATDGVVNGVDLAAVLNNWGTTGGALGADANGDGVVDGADLALVLNSWGPCPK